MNCGTGPYKTLHWEKDAYKNIFLWEIYLFHWNRYLFK